MARVVFTAVFFISITTLFAFSGTICAKQDASADVPSGAVMFFNLAECPTGWLPLENARGRVLVGIQESGKIGAQVGTALADQENRAVGKHSHVINDPGHVHRINARRGWTQNGSNLGVADYSGNTERAVTGVTLQETGAQEGTPAPYLQLLVCQKI